MNTTRSTAAAVALCAVAAITLSALPGEAGAGVTIQYFTDEGGFHDFIGGTGKILKGIEDFEYAQLPQGQHAVKVPFPDHLTGGVPNGPFPEGLMSPNLTIQTNRNPGPLAPVDVPSTNPQALYVVGAGAFGSNSIKVGEDLGILSGVHCSMDLIFSSDDKTGVCFELSRFASFGADGWTLGIFDTSDVLIGQYTIAGPVAVNPSKTFFGVWSAVPIGRINIYDPNPTSPDAVDNIEMWTVPAPGATCVLALGGVLAARRRRR